MLFNTIKNFFIDLFSNFSFFKRSIPKKEKFENRVDPINPRSNPHNTPRGAKMELEVLRYSSGKESTLGALFDVTEGRKFLCYTLEDEFRTKKVYNETRIPANRYEIEFRTVGGFHQKYSQKFGDTHKGMLWIRNVPGFKYVLIHIGNKDDDTAGCLLVGDTSIQNITEEGFIGNSTAAYNRIYPVIASELEQNKKVYITFIDYDS